MQSQRVKMKKRKNYNTKEKIYKWTPRILILLFVIFFSILTLDGPFTPIGILLYIIPPLLLLTVAIIAFYKPREAGVFFIMVMVFFTFFFDLYKNIYAFLIIGMPLLLIGILFYRNGQKKRNK